MNEKYLDELENEYQDFLNSKASPKAQTLWCGNGRVENSRFRFSVDITEDVLKSMVDKVLTLTVLPSKQIKFGNTHSVVVSSLPLPVLAEADQDGVIAKGNVNAGKFSFAVSFDLIKQLSWTNQNNKKKMTLEAISNGSGVSIVRFLNAGHPMATAIKSGTKSQASEQTRSVVVPIKKVEAPFYDNVDDVPDFLKGI